MYYRRRPYRRTYPARRGGRSGDLRSILLTLLLFSAIGLIIVYLPVNRRPAESLQGPVYVIDGDTVILNKVHIRLLGIDAPETEQNCRKADTNYACGKDARKILLTKIGRASIRCEKKGIDKYGRTLGRCYLGDVDLNRWMVEQGWAVSYGDYRSEENEARRERLGIWAGQFELPYQWRKEHQTQPAEPETGHEVTQPDAISRIGDYIRERIDAILGLL